MKRQTSDSRLLTKCARQLRSLLVSSVAILFIVSISLNQQHSIDDGGPGRPVWGAWALAQSSTQFFDVQPEPVNHVQNGHDIRLRCIVRNRQGECLWLRNGRAIGTIAKKYQFARQPEDGDCSLLIRNVSVQQDDGQWQCQVTSPELDQDTLQSREVQLVVLVAPERPQIKNMTSTSGTRLVLEENKTKIVVCEMRGGNPAPQIEWILDNKNVSKEAQSSSFMQPPPAGAPSSAPVRVTQSRLRLADIKRAMNGKGLACVGVHPTLNQTHSVELDVQYVPTVSVVQREYSIVEGSPLSISCQVDANPPPNLVNWRLVSDGSSQPQLGKQEAAKQGALTQPTRPGPVLEFERISRDLNQNVFECLAQNSYGISLPADVKLNVLYAPFLLNTSHSESVLLGSQAQLACLFDGNPEPEVKWHYTDPLSRSAQAAQLLEGNKNQQQYLTIKNVTYRNEGDYHCEARNQINGVYYAVRSSNIILDVFGEPQFLVKSPVHAKAVQGNKAELALTFCSDPPPNKVYWQFGSLRLDVRLGAGAQSANNFEKGPSASNRRFQAGQLQSLQRRDSSFSKLATCFEAQLAIAEAELTDQRDYTLVVQNERGHQSASVRLRVASPLSPVLMITSAFVTICGLFLASLVVMFLVKKRHEFMGSLAGASAANGSASNGASAQGAPANGNSHKSTELHHHLTNGANGSLAPAQANGGSNGTSGQLIQQQQAHTRNGVVNGLGNGLPNNAFNPVAASERGAHAHHLSSLGSSAAACSTSSSSSPPSENGSSRGSSTGANDQKQLLLQRAERARDSGRSASARSATSQLVAMSVVDFTTGVPGTGACASPANAPPPPRSGTPNGGVRHIAEQAPDDGAPLDGSTYRAAESVTSDAPLSLYTPTGGAGGAPAGGLIYANIDSQLAACAPGSPAAKRAGHAHAHPRHARSAGAPQSLAEPGAELSALAAAASLDGRPNVGATIAMMNSLAAAAAAAAATSQQPAAVHSPASGALNQQLAQSRQLRKPGPPKPPKPSIQQRSRFYAAQQMHQHHQQAGQSSPGLVMIGSPGGGHLNAAFANDAAPAGHELADEYSRIAFPARAEL